MARYESIKQTHRTEAKYLRTDTQHESASLLRHGGAQICNVNNGSPNSPFDVIAFPEDARDNPICCIRTTTIITTIADKSLREVIVHTMPEASKCRSLLSPPPPLWHYSPIIIVIYFGHIATPNGFSHSLLINLTHSTTSRQNNIYRPLDLVGITCIVKTLPRTTTFPKHACRCFPNSATKPPSSSSWSRLAPSWLSSPAQLTFGGCQYLILIS